jgi:hypothetical protein
MALVTPPVRIRSQKRSGGARSSNSGRGSVRGIGFLLVADDRDRRPQVFFLKTKVCARHGTAIRCRALSPIWGMKKGRCRDAARTAPR